MQRPFPWIAPSVILGIFLQDSLRASPIIPGVLSAAIFVSLGLSLRRARVFVSLLVAFSMAAGAFWVSVYDRWQEPFNLEPFQEADVYCLGVVQDSVESEKGFGGAPSHRFVLGTVSVEKDGKVEAARGRVRVFLRARRPPDLKPGDRVVLFGKLEQVSGATNPGEWSRRDWLARRSQFYELKVPSALDLFVTQKGGFSLARFLSDLRSRGLSLIGRYVTAPYAGLAQALVLGDRTGIEQAISDRFIETGTVHVLSISGLHVGILAVILLFVLRHLIGSIPVRMTLLILLLVVYIPLTGAQAPVVRSVLLFVFLALGRLVGRGSDPLNSLALAALVLVGLNPHGVEEIGFQLSFGGVLSIMLMSPSLIERWDPWLGRKAPGRFLVRLAAVSTAAWLGLAPLILLRFNLVTPVSLIANLAVVPLLTPILALFVIFFLVAPFGVFWGQALGRAVGWSLGALDLTVDFFAGVPYGFYYLSSPLPWVIGACYAVLVVLLFKGYIRRYAFPVLAVLLIMLNLWAWRFLAQRNNNLALAFLDVGQGDALVLEAPGGGVWVVDAGLGEPADKGRRVVVPYLWSEGVQRVSGTIVTHPDADHAGGMARIARLFPARAALEGDLLNSPGRTLDRYTEAVRTARVPRMTLARGDRIRSPSGFEVVCLHPPREWHGASHISENDRSLVLKVTYGDFSAILTGDIEEKGIRSLLDSGLDIKADVLKVPHHGARLDPGILAELMEGVRPRYAVVSVGAANRYGHPDRGTLELIQESCRLLRTDLSGAIIFRLRGGDLKVSTYGDGNSVTL